MPETSEAFSESAKAFDKKHAGGLVPFNMFHDMIRAPDCWAKMIKESLWITSGDAWIKIDPDGTIEIGTSGA